ncbi:hypothetical protein, partial [Tsukamurella sp. NPDC003166]|uniref:hypothetical protein n=1 Tax=Tsukamurella sp. NPDC003166 TaxID=3154444 RepID=UPI0033A6290A
LWTSPDGRRYIVDPTGIMLTLFPDLTRIQWDIPTTPSGAAQGAGEQTRPGGRTRLQREHARRERLRRDNITAFEAERDRQALPVSEVEVGMMHVIGAPTPRPAPSFDGPPPY